MRRAVGYVLVGLGAFLLVLAPLLHWYVTPRAAVAPLACTSGPLCDKGVSLSPSDGVALTLFDPATLKILHQRAGDQQDGSAPTWPASTGADNRTVYDESLATVRASDNTVDRRDDGADRVQRSHSQMIDCCGSNTDGVPVNDFCRVDPLEVRVRHAEEDLPVLRPDAQQGHADEVLDVETMTASSVQVRAGHPADADRRPSRSPATWWAPPTRRSRPEVLRNTRTVWVEPVTGVIVKGREQQ